MTLFEIIIIFLILTTIIIFIYVLLYKNHLKNSSVSDKDILLLQQQIQNLSYTVDKKLSETNNVMQKTSITQFRESKALIQTINKDVNEQLKNVIKGVSEVGESSKEVFVIAEQLQNLEKVLKHQKQRGNLGEASLQLILENILPANIYKFKHIFKDRGVVDAVIETKDGLIPIDAKFSLDNYRRLLDANTDSEREMLQKIYKNDLKKRIDETAKYIRPEEGTLPFAFMYIPAEAIYYDLLINEVGSTKVNTRSIIDYAYTDKNVIVVSPTTFSAYLQSVLYGFRAFKIEESAKKIGKQVELLNRHLKSYEEYFIKVGNSLNTATNNYQQAQHEFHKIDKDVTKIINQNANNQISQTSN